MRVPSHAVADLRGLPCPRGGATDGTPVYWRAGAYE
jgi:hypothetical protein